MKEISIAQIGQGFVGSALKQSFKKRGTETVVYDKFLKVGNISDTLEADFIFLCLPTPYVEDRGFDLGAIEESLEYLKTHSYEGLCVIKSTIEPGSCRQLAEKFSLNVAHNPEFLTERTAFQDFDSQSHIVLGRVQHSELFERLVLFYKELYPEAAVSICEVEESESMKLFANAFYAQKIMIFNEFYSLCEKMNMDFEKIKRLMLKNKWIAPHHITVPGPDGKMAYGGHCFPKDTEALSQLMKSKKSPSRVLAAAIEERNAIRKD